MALKNWKKVREQTPQEIKDLVRSKMDVLEFAEREAIEFAEWANRNYVWEYYGPGNIRWMPNQYGIPGVWTTKELYDFFVNQKNGSNAKPSN